jgi:hypothetical protein
MRRVIILAAVLLLKVTVVLADWSLPLILRPYGDLPGAQLIFGIQAVATDGFDPGQDVPAKPYHPARDQCYASFHHPEWQATAGGKAVTDFERDLRRQLPQTFSFQVACNVPVEVHWPTSGWPPNTSFELFDPTTGTTIAMTNSPYYTVNPGGNAPLSLMVRVAEFDADPPAAPSGVELEETTTALQVSWDANIEPDLAGYKVYVGTQSDTYAQVIDVGRSTRFVLSGLSRNVEYVMAITAFDEELRESDYSSEVSGRLVISPEDELNPERGDTPKTPDEDESGNLSDIAQMNKAEGVARDAGCRQQYRSNLSMVMSPGCMNSSSMLIPGS